MKYNFFQNLERYPIYVKEILENLDILSLSIWLNGSHIIYIYFVYWIGINQIFGEADYF